MTPRPQARGTSKGTTSLSQTGASGSRCRRPAVAMLNPALAAATVRRLGVAETHVQPHLATVMWRPDKLRFLIGVKNPPDSRLRSGYPSFPHPSGDTFSY
jgi:hypothetical protein